MNIFTIVISMISIDLDLFLLVFSFCVFSMKYMKSCGMALCFLSFSPTPIETPEHGNISIQLIWAAIYSNPFSRYWVILIYFRKAMIMSRSLEWKWPATCVLQPLLQCAAPLPMCNLALSSQEKSIKLINTHLNEPGPDALFHRIHHLVDNDSIDYCEANKNLGGRGMKVPFISFWSLYL